MGLFDRNVLIMKPVPEGYLYRLPSPWVFGRARYYLLTEEQKNRLVAALTDSHPVRSAIVAAAVVGALVLLTVGAIIAYGILVDRSFAGSGLAAGIVATIVFLGAGYLVALVTTRASIARVCAALPDRTPTDRRLTDTEVRDAADAGISQGLRLTLTLMFALAFVLSASGLAMRAWDQAGFRWTDAIQAASGLAFGALAVVHGSRWLKGRR